MIAKILTVAGSVQSNVSEADFLKGKDKLASELVRTLQRLKLVTLSKTAGSAKDSGMGAVIEIRLRFAGGRGILPRTPYQATGRFVVTRQGGNLSVNFQVANWGFANATEFANFKALWSVSARRALEQMVKSVYPHEIMQI